MQLRSHTKRCRVLKEAIREATDEEPAVKIEPPELTVVNVHLPPEILHHVITFLPWQYAAQLQRVCKSLKSYINDRVLGNCYARELIGTGNPLRWALTTHSNWSDVGHNCSVPPQNVQQIAFVALGKMYMEQASISRLLGTLGPDFDNFESKVILVEMLSILERAIMAGHYQAAEMLLSYTKKDISAALDRGEISDALWEREAS
ncbi:hypothetical protein DFJ77DRAFT_129093 [Powellomyces hirtus]|nr:hypothetical protein DFJ77DRAFT_129093 [Powellomyces hirtus]